MILNHYAISPDMPGITRHYDLGRELVKNGYSVTIIASGFDHISKKFIKISRNQLFKLEDLQNVKFIWVRTIPYYGNDWRRILNMISYAVQSLQVAKLVDRPDIVIGSSMHPFAVIAGWWLAKKYRARFFFEVRDLWPQTAIDMGAMKPTSIQARCLYAWEKFMYKRADKIIVIPPRSVDYIGRYGIDAKKVLWIPNGVDLDRFDEIDPLICESAITNEAQYKGKFKVIYAGAHGPANGLDVVLNAAKIVGSSDIHFFLIGDGPEKKRLIEKVSQESLINVTFMEPVAKSQIPSLLRQADLLLHCLKPFDALKYGMSPNKLYDYLASGKPIIVSAFDPDNIVEKAHAGIMVEPGNPGALADAVMSIYKMPAEQRDKLGENGRLYVEEYHDIKKIGKKLAKALG